MTQFLIPDWLFVCIPFIGTAIWWVVQTMSGMKMREFKLSEDAIVQKINTHMVEDQHNHESIKNEIQEHFFEITEMRQQLSSLACRVEAIDERTHLMLTILQGKK